MELAHRGRGEMLLLAQGRPKKGRFLGIGVDPSGEQGIAARTHEDDRNRSG